ASLGGAMAGVRLLGWRAIPAPVAGATVIIETVLTLIASWVFAATGVALLVEQHGAAAQVHRIILALLFCLPIPPILIALQASGSAVGRLHDLLVRISGVPAPAMTALDEALRSGLRQRRRLVGAGILHLAALVSGSAETWFSLHLFGYGTGAGGALLLESMV